MSANAQKVLLNLREINIGTPERLVLMVLAFHYNDIEECARPSIGKLATETGLSEQRIHELMKSLVAKGMLTKEGQGGKGVTNRYRFPWLNGQNSLTVCHDKESEFSDPSGEKGMETLTLLNEGEGQTVRILVPPDDETVRILVEETPKGSENSDPKENTRKSTYEVERVPSPSPSPSLIATETTTRAPRQKRASKQVTTEPTTAREKGLAILADADFMADIATDFPDRNIPYEGKKWLEYITEKPPKGNYKNSLRNWLEKSRQFERGSIARVPATYQNGTGKKPPLGDFSNGDQEPQYLRAKIVGLSDAEDAIQLAPVQGGRTR